MRKLIRANGSSMELPAGMSLSELTSLIGAERCDTVVLHHMGEPLHIMIVDDRGYEVTAIRHSPTHTELRTGRALKPVNAEATSLYLANCKRGTTHQIVGDVVIVPDSDFA